MAITTGDVLRLVVSQIWDTGDIMQNVYALQITGGGGPWDDDDVLDDLEDYADAMYANLTIHVVDEVNGNEIFGYRWDSGDQDFDLFGTEPWAWDPSSTDSQLPRGVASFLKAPTTNPDVQGRKYLGGHAEDVLAQGVWTAGLIAALALFGGDWVTPLIGTLTGATLTPGVWSVKLSQFFPFTAEVGVVTIPAYQRRRKRGVGI